MHRPVTTCLTSQISAHISSKKRGGFHQHGCDDVEETDGWGVAAGLLCNDVARKLTFSHILMASDQTVQDENVLNTKLFLRDIFETSGTPTTGHLNHSPRISRTETSCQGAFFCCFIGCTPRGSCTNMLLRRVLRRFFKGSAP